MEKAYVLLTVEIRSEKDVLNTLDEIPNVKEAYQIYGIYDFLIRVETETSQKLMHLIEKRIRGIRKVRSILSLTCMKESDVQVGIRKRV